MEVIKALEDLQFKDIDLKGRRVVGAGTAVSDFDYMTMFDVKNITDALEPKQSDRSDTALSSTGPIRIGAYATRGAALAHRNSLFLASDRSFISFASNGSTWNYHAGTQRAAAADRPTPTSDEGGYRFYATDTQQETRWDGAAWLENIVFGTTVFTANNLMLGAGTRKVTPLGALGTTTTVLHGNAGGAPTFAAVSLTADVSGVLPGANGGTGQSGYAVGDLLYGSGASALSKLAASTAGCVLTSGGAVTAPAWSAAALYGSTAYTPTNVTTDRSFDADTVATPELADVVGTLIADLQTKGVLS